MAHVIDALVLEQEKITPTHYRLRLSAPAIAAVAQPGQFMLVSCGTPLDPLLRRPFSIFTVEREAGAVTLFYRIAGRGTAILTALRAGSEVNIMGPLGRGFSLPAPDQPALLVAGGMGVAPLYFLAQELTRHGCATQVFYGTPTANQLFFAPELSQDGRQLQLATDDGSAGRKGTVTALLADYLAALPPDVLTQARVFACGPQGMLRHLCELLKQVDVSGEISLEERMACGVGACLACVCKTKSATAWQYSRTCVDGPVFPVAEVIWD